MVWCRRGRLVWCRRGRSRSGGKCRRLSWSGHVTSTMIPTGWYGVDVTGRGPVGWCGVDVTCWCGVDAAGPTTLTPCKNVSEPVQVMPSSSGPLFDRKRTLHETRPLLPLRRWTCVHVIDMVQKLNSEMEKLIYDNRDHDRAMCDRTVLVKRNLDHPSGHLPQPDASRPQPIIPRTALLNVLIEHVS